MKLKRCCCLCFSLLLAAMPAAAGDTFWQERQRGYYWYEDPIEVPEAEKIPVAVQPPEGIEAPQDTYTYDEMLTLHPDQLKVVVDTRLKTAVHQPSEDNVLRFLEALDAAKQKSRTLANVAGYVASQHPQLTGESRYPYSQPGRSAYLEQRSDEIKQGLNHYRDQYAIIAFNQAGCSYCDVPGRDPGSLSAVEPLDRAPGRYPRKTRPWQPSSRSRSPPRCFWSPGIASSPRLSRRG